MDAITLLLNSIANKGIISLNESERIDFEKAIQEALEQQKFNIMEAYQEGYDAAFHHEPSDAEKYYIEKVNSWKIEK